MAKYLMYLLGLVHLIGDVTVNFWWVSTSYNFEKVLVDLEWVIDDTEPVIADYLGF